MQTFLPYPDFHRSAASLDRQRLGKQRVECLQIMKCVLFPENAKGWVNHPAVKMWEGCPRHLFQYQVVVCNTWTSRGYKDTCLQKSTELMLKLFEQSASACSSVTELSPWWLGHPKFHRAHQSMLVIKDRDHYLPQFGSPTVFDYWWPTDHEDEK